MPFGYPRTFHLDDSGLGRGTPSRERVRWTDLAGRHVVIEEKIDGSETSLEFDGDGNPVARFRGEPLSLDRRGGAEAQFNDLKDLLEERQDGLFDRIGDRYRVYGEWTFAAHRVFYDSLPAYFLEFDVMDKSDGSFLSTPDRADLLAGLGFVSVPVLASRTASPDWHPKALVARSLFKSEHWRRTAEATSGVYGLDFETTMARLDPSDLAEGVYGKVEEDGKVVLRLKWIREDFVRGIVEGGRHWKDMPLLRNRTPNDNVKG